jgi:hypothetical protein
VVALWTAVWGSAGRDVVPLSSAPSATHPARRGLPTDTGWGRVFVGDLALDGEDRTRRTATKGVAALGWKLGGV